METEKTKCWRTFGWVVVLLVCLPLAGCTFAFSPQLKDFIRYRIKPGDSLSEVATRFSVSIEELEDYNSIRDPSLIRVGQELKIPYHGQDVKTRIASRSSSPSPSRGVGGSTPKRLKGLETIAVGDAENHVGRLKWPVKGGTVTSKFGWRWLSFHEGIDIAASSGTPIYAAHNAVVAYSGNGIKGYGNIVVLKGDGIVTVYGHNKRNRVKAGQRVKLGQRIADLGSTGKSSGPHLHFETRVRDASGRNAAVNPLVFFGK